MSLLRLCTRVTRLEARRPPRVDDFAPPDFSDAFVVEVYRILLAYGGFTSVATMLDQCHGLTDPALVAEIERLLTETPADAL